jgi:hypothetical protein
MNVIISFASALPFFHKRFSCNQLTNHNDARRAHQANFTYVKRVRSGAPSNR